MVHSSWKDYFGNMGLSVRFLDATGLDGCGQLFRKVDVCPSALGLNIN